MWISTLQVGGIKTPIERQKPVEWKKQPQIYIVYKNSNLNIKTHRLQVNKTETDNILNESE